MKRKLNIIALMLGILTGIPSFVSAKVKVDSLVMNRIFSYQRNFTQDVEGKQQNVYMKTKLQTVKRNALLWLVPHMYSVAKGSRSFIDESYSRLTFRNIDDYEIRRQVVSSTIRHYRRAMPVQEKFMIPNLYDVAMYNDQILSPFHRSNRKSYRYHIIAQGDGTAIVRFKPRFIKNTQLISGEAVVDYWTGRIIKATLDGEFDMITFHTTTEQGEDGASSLLPKTSKTDIRFSLLGNQILSTFEAAYDCPTTLHDTVDIKGDRELMATLRPFPLDSTDLKIYHEYDLEHPQEEPDTVQTEEVDTIEHKHHYNAIDLAWDIGDQLISSLRAENENGYIKLSPIINPQYLSYSKSKGVSYKMKLRGRYAFNAHRYFEMWPDFGYNFKLRQFYFTAPIRFNYNPKRNGYVEVVYGNGNRISHSSIAEEVMREHDEIPDIDRLTEFSDNHFIVSNNIMLFDWIDIETGIIMHQRKAIDPDALRQMGKVDEFRSFAPKLTVKLRPWGNGPVFTVNYERGLKNINRSNIEYEQWEMDASAKLYMNRLRLFNFKLGSGFYTRKRDNYFVDFTNFRDNNLPESWDDDWTGNFQLLDSRWYNTSKYYLRSNISYESPLMLATTLPIVGRFIERERFYLSTLSIEHTRLYNELGYGFTCRAFSMGLFTSFLNTEFQKLECKFTFELFSRW